MTELHRVLAVVSPQQSTFELASAAEVFGLPRSGLAMRYSFGVCAEHPGRIPTLANFDLAVDLDLSALREADTIVIPGWQRHDELPSARLIEAIRREHARGARIVAICSAAFVLAHAGLLDGRRATTHWVCARALAERFPKIQVDPDVLYIDHGDIATSAGTAAGVDLCLHLVQRDFGAAYAQEIARRMVMPPRREGGQLQFVSPSVPGASTEGLSSVLEWAAVRLADPISLADLAAYAGMSTRTLARRFRDQLGTSPGHWLQTQRIAAAQALLEETDLPIESIATRVGLNSATNLRRRFQNALRTTPGGYRRTFHHQEPAHTT